jgi:PAS domain S-box-containing protein
VNNHLGIEREKAVTVRLQRTQRGQSTATLSILRDLNDGKQAEAANAYLATVVQASGIAILSLTIDGMVQSWNPAAERLFGYSVAEAVGQPIRFIAGPEHHNEQRKALLRLRTGETICIETVCITNQGSSIDVIWTASPIVDTAGKIQGFAGAFTDITLHKQAQLAEIRQRLIQAQEAERQHLAREIHDGAIQELAAFDFALYFLTEQLSDPASKEELASLRARLTQIVQKLRRTTIMLRPPTAVGLGLASAIQEVVDEIQQLQPSLTVAVELPAALPVLPPNVTLALYRIGQQALYNIVQHARATQVRVCLRTESSVLDLEVQDNGQGFTLPESWVELAQRQHLGIVGMMERADSIGGHLKIQSASGQGTLVRFAVPLPSP